MEWTSSLGPVGPVLRGVIVFLEAILVLNLMILVHEWGHFLAARWRGLKVEKFYIWFGKPIWKRVYNGVEYGLGSIPLGGFVQLPQMGPMGGIEGEEEGKEKLPTITPLDKIIVAFAGPLFSFLLAVVFAWMVYFLGMPDRRIHTTTIGWVDPKSAAAEAKFQPGDKILTIDGVEVHSWDEPIDSVKERIAFSKGEKIVFIVQREGEAKPVRIESGFKVQPGGWFQRRGLRTVGLSWEFPAKVYEVLKDSAGERAGLKKGDVVLSVNGARVHSYAAIFDIAARQSDKPITMAVSRDGKEQNITLTPLAPSKPEKLPEDDQVKGQLLTGVLFESLADAKELGLVTPHPHDQIAQAATMMFRTLGAITGTRGDVGIQQMGGPVKIISTYTMLFQIPDGWRLVLWFSVVLNVNLALMNLLPFPVFDGGHIVMAFGEWIKRGSLLPVKIMEMVQTACVVLLLGFFVYVTWFDLNDVAGTSKDKGADIEKSDIVYPAAK